MSPRCVTFGLVEEGLIVQRALGWHTYQWAMANVAHFPTLKGVNWVQAMNAARWRSERFGKRYAVIHCRTCTRRHWVIVRAHEMARYISTGLAESLEV